MDDTNGVTTNARTARMIHIDAENGAKTDQMWMGGVGTNMTTVESTSYTPLAVHVSFAAAA